MTEEEQRVEAWIQSHRDRRIARELQEKLVRAPRRDARVRLTQEQLTWLLQKTAE